MIRYTSPKQLSLSAFKTPFEQNLLPSNRWVILSEVIPWDELATVYHRQMSSAMGRGSINTRLVIGVLIIKHMLKLDDREVLATLQENVYLQYFVGFSSFQTKIAFDPSLLVTIRKRMGQTAFDEWSQIVIKQIETIESEIIELAAIGSEIVNNNKTKEPEAIKVTGQEPKVVDNNNKTEESEVIKVIGQAAKVIDNKNKSEKAIAPKDTLIIDTTVAEQKIKYPTDLDLLNRVREKTESLIDIFYEYSSFTIKPRTYRENARKEYLRASMKRKKSGKEIRKALKKQLGFIERNIRIINTLWDDIENTMGVIPAEVFKILFKIVSYKTWFVCQEVYRQQKEMIDNNVKSCTDRIVSISQPHVRAIVRGKSGKNIEFGAKVALSVVNGTNRIFKIAWDAYNDGIDLIGQVEAFKVQYGKYPLLVLADKIYLTKANRDYLKKHNIQHRGQPLGRPKTDEQGHKIKPFTPIQQKENNQRNHVEGQFGTAKDAYNLNRVKAKLPQTSESWIANIFFILNIIKLLKVAQIAMNRNLCALFSVFKKTFFFTQNRRFYAQSSNNMIGI